MGSRRAQYAPPTTSCSPSSRHSARTSPPSSRSIPSSPSPDHPDHQSPISPGRFDRPTVTRNQMTPNSVTSVVASARMNPFHIAIVAMCSLLMIVDGYDMVAYGTVIVHLMDEWHMDPVLAGTLGSMALVGMLVGGLFIAPLADRFGRRPLMITCVSIASLASFSCAFTTGPLQLGGLRFVVGIALGALVPNFVALTSEIAPRAAKATLVTRVSSFYSVGGVAAAVF